jgi:hypothetical protein
MRLRQRRQVKQEAEPQPGADVVQRSRKEPDLGPVSEPKPPAQGAAQLRSGPKRGFGVATGDDRLNPHVVLFVHHDGAHPVGRDVRAAVSAAVGPAKRHIAPEHKVAEVVGVEPPSVEPDRPRLDFEDGPGAQSDDLGSAGGRGPVGEGHPVQVPRIPAARADHDVEVRSRSSEPGRRRHRAATSEGGRESHCLLVANGEERAGKRERSDTAHQAEDSHGEPRSRGSAGAPPGAARRRRSSNPDIRADRPRGSVGSSCRIPHIQHQG